MTFDTFGLVEPLVRAVREKGYKIPTPIQSATIENVLKDETLWLQHKRAQAKPQHLRYPCYND